MKIKNFEVLKLIFVGRFLSILNDVLHRKLEEIAFLGLNISKFSKGERYAYPIFLFLGINRVSILFFSALQHH